MNRATPPAGYDAGRDPDFHAADVGPEKPAAAREHVHERRRRRRRTRTVLLLVALASAWIVVLVDPHIGPLVVFALAALGATLGILLAAMGLGLLGFALCTVGERFIAWLRRGSSWPDS